MPPGIELPGPDPHSEGQVREGVQQVSRGRRAEIHKARSAVWSQPILLRGLQQKDGRRKGSQVHQTAEIPADYFEEIQLRPDDDGEDQAQRPSHIPLRDKHERLHERVRAHSRQDQRRGLRIGNRGSCGQEGEHSKKNFPESQQARSEAAEQYQEQAAP